MSTQQQQLAALGPTFEVDGVKWEAEICDTFSTLKSKVGIMDLHITLHLSENVYCFFFINGEKIKEFTATTIEDACREAIKLCRERVAELGKALGMVSFIDQQAFEAYLLAERYERVPIGQMMQTEIEEANGRLQAIRDTLNQSTP